MGAPVTGTPYNGVALSYTLSDGNSGDVEDSFVIDSATGQISVGEGATLDYETKSSYTGQVEYTVDSHAAVINVTINVTEIVPGKPGTPTLTRTEFSEPTAPALDVTWTAAAANGLTITGYEAQYRKKAAEGEEAAEWTAYSGTLGATATTFNLAGLEAGATYEAQVRALSDEGAGPWSDTGEGTANRPPNPTIWFFLDATFDIGESHLNTLVGYFEDADTDTLRYAASSNNPGVIWTRMDDENPAFMLNDGLNPGTATVTYGAHDDYGGYASRTVTITVRNGNATLSVAENSAAGTAVGDPVTGTPYNGVALTYTLTGEAATSNAFEIDSATGQISVKEGATLDHETKNSYTGKVEYTVDGNAAVINVTINVTDVTAPQPDAPTVTRSTTNPTTVLDVAWTAPADNGSGAITDYDVQYREKGDEDWTDHAFTGTQTSLRRSPA